jgi:hypothetical protein
VSYRSTVLAQTRAGYWRLGELTGTSAVDSSGNARNGTYTNTYTLGASTILADGDAGLTLTGAGYVTMGDVAAFEFTGTLSVEYWFKHAATVAAEQAIIGKMSTAGAGYRSTMLTTGKIRWLLQTSVPANIATLDTLAAYNDDRWHHCVHTWTGDTSANGVKTYIDGVLENQTTAGAGALPSGLTDPFVLGGYGPSFLLPWIGSLDDCSVTSSVLTPTQIAQLYAERLKATTSIFVNSVDRSLLTRFTDSEILDQLNEVPNTATIVVRGFTPELGETVEIKTETTTIFKGIVTDRTQLQVISGHRKRYQLDCMDGTYLLNRRLVNHDYASQAANSIAYSLVASYTTGYTAANIQTGLSTVDLPNKMETVGGALSRLANLDGSFWYLDYTNDLHFRRTEVLGNPQSLDTTKVFAYRNMRYSRRLPPVTRVYVEGQGTTTALAREPGATTLPILDRTPFSASGGAVISGSQILTYTGLGTATNPNPEVWHAQIGISGQWYSIAWSPALRIFAAVGNNVAMSSPDGITWTSRTPADTGLWNDVCWSPELAIFVAVAQSGTNRVMTSTNGTSWSAQSASEANTWNGVCWSAALTLFVAVASDGTHRVMTSSNGTSWTNQTASSAVAWIRVCWSPTQNLFVAVSTTGGTQAVMTSSNGTAWTTQTHTSASLRDVVWADRLGLFVATGDTAFMTSSNGTSWTLNATIGSVWRGVAWSEETGVLIAVADTTAVTHQIAMSRDGLNWTLLETHVATTNGWWKVVWSAELGVFAAVSASGSTVYVISTAGDALDALVGIPATGANAIQARINEGDEINLLVTRNDTTAQTALAALEGGDGIHEAYVQDRRLSETSAQARGDAELALGADEADTLTVVSEDPFMIAGRNLTVNISSISVTLRIQQVTIGWDEDRLLPQRQVTASNVFKTLYQYLRDLDDRHDSGWR